MAATIIPISLEDQPDFQLSHNTPITHEIPSYVFLKKKRRVTSMQNLPFVLTVDELMEVLDIGRNTAYALVRSGQIRSIKVGKIYRIPRDAVEEFLKK